MNKDLTFVVLAYKELHTLEECVESLVKQEQKCEVIISTSTPNDYIKSIAKKYNVKLKINPKRGEYEDVIFAYKQAKTPFITLCHQDDIYLPNYSSEIIKKIKKNSDAFIIFGDYYDYKNGKIIKSSLLLKIKRLMNFIFRFKIFNKSKFWKRRIVSLGNSICSPTVAYNKELLDKPIIVEDCKTSWDWNTWINLSNKKGRFVYINKPILYRRIHENSETSQAINNNIRRETDYKLFCKFWPKPIAKFLSNLYSKSEKSNEI